MGDIVQFPVKLPERARELRAFIAIDSAQRPGTYSHVTLILHDAPDEQIIAFDSGDFIADWDAAITYMIEHAKENGYTEMVLAQSSSVDHWESESCQYIELPADANWPFPRWRHATHDEQRAARDAYDALERELSEARHGDN